MYVHFTWVQVVFGQAWTFSVVDYSLLLSASFRVMGDQHRKDEVSLTHESLGSYCFMFIWSIHLLYMSKKTYRLSVHTRTYILFNYHSI